VLFKLLMCISETICLFSIFTLANSGSWLLCAIANDHQSGIHTNEKAVVVFRFFNRPEYINIGSRLLFREGRTKGMGEVTKIFPLLPEVPPCRWSAVRLL